MLPAFVRYFAEYGSKMEIALTIYDIDQPRPSTTRSVDRLTVESYLSRADLGNSAAADISRALIARLKSQPMVRMVFAAAPSQAEMLKSLSERNDIDWSRVTAFHMDEYVGLRDRAPQRFGEWLNVHLFAKQRFSNVNIISPGVDLAAETSRYSNLLNSAKIDFVCLGVGVNGHIAFNDPSVADFDDPLDVKVVELDAVCRRQQVDDECFARIEDVPERAITLTVPRLLRSDKMFCVVPGTVKRNAVRAMLNGPITTACPASILRQHPACTLYLNQESDPDE